MDLDDRIKRQFPALVVTFLSVLIGLCFSDLVSLARARMMLWPLDIETLRTWGQLFAMAGVGMSVWVIFAHMAVSRLRIPTLADSIIVLIIPAAILFGNSLVGLKEVWPWFYYASLYLVISVLAWLWQVRVALQESELASFARLAHPLGPLSVLYVGIPFYAAAGWADSRGLLSPTLEMLVAMSAGPAAVLTAWLFFKAWHIAIANAQTPKAVP